VAADQHGSLWLLFGDDHSNQGTPGLIRQLAFAVVIVSPIASAVAKSFFHVTLYSVLWLHFGCVVLMEEPVNLPDRIVERCRAV